MDSVTSRAFTCPSSSKAYWRFRRRVLWADCLLAIILHAPKVQTSIDETTKKKRKKEKSNILFCFIKSSLRIQRKGLDASTFVASWGPFQLLGLQPCPSGSRSERLLLLGWRQRAMPTRPCFPHHLLAWKTSTLTNYHWKRDKNSASYTHKMQCFSYSYAEKHLYRRVPPPLAVGFGVRSLAIVRDKI